MADAVTIKHNFKASQSVGIFNNQVVTIILIAQSLSLALWGFDFYTQASIFITLTQGVLLFFNIGKNIPIKYLIGFLYSVNYLLSPTLMFNGFNEYVDPNYQMVGLPEDYFPYAISAILMLISGLHILKVKDPVLNVRKITAIVKKYPKLPYYLIVVGLVCGFFESYLPAEISIFFGCFSYFKYVGFMLSLFNGKRVNYIYFLFSYGVGIVISLATSLFGDLLIMLLFLSIILAFRYKPSNLGKLMGFASIILIIVFVQVIKMPLRARVGGTTSITDIKDAINEGREQDESKSFNNKVADVVMRLDQGWVTSKCIVYKQTGGYDFQHGAHMLVVLESAILPHVLVPNKLAIGDPQEFNKYSGHHVEGGTSIALGLLADGYIDFAGMGILVCFAFGIVISVFTKIYNNLEITYPLIIMFIPVGFGYAIKPDNDTQSALGPLVKLTFIIWLIFSYFGKRYNVDDNKANVLPNDLTEAEEA